MQLGIERMQNCKDGARVSFLSELKKELVELAHERKLSLASLSTSDWPIKVKLEADGCRTSKTSNMFIVNMMITGSRAKAHSQKTHRLLSVINTNEKYMFLRYPPSRVGGDMKDFNTCVERLIEGQQLVDVKSTPKKWLENFVKLERDGYGPERVTQYMHAEDQMVAHGPLGQHSGQALEKNDLLKVVYFHHTNKQDTTFECLKIMKRRELLESYERCPRS